MAFTFLAIFVKIPSTLHFFVMRCVRCVFKMVTMKRVAINAIFASLGEVRTLIMPLHPYPSSGLERWVRYP